MPKAKTLKKEYTQLSFEEQLEQLKLRAKLEGKDIKIEKIEELPHLQGELDVRELPDGDKFQLLIRYLNNFIAYLKNILVSVNSVDTSIYAIANEKGIDIDKIKAKLQDEALAQLMAQQKKEELKN